VVRVLEGTYLLLGRRGPTNHGTRGGGGGTDLWGSWRCGSSISMIGRIHGVTMVRILVSIVTTGNAEMMGSTTTIGGMCLL
jgi:hypothetical protein